MLDKWIERRGGTDRHIDIQMIDRQIYRRYTERLTDGPDKHKGRGRERERDEFTVSVEIWPKE